MNDIVNIYKYVKSIKSAQKTFKMELIIEHRENLSLTELDPELGPLPLLVSPSAKTFCGWPQ